MSQLRSCFFLLLLLLSPLISNADQSVNERIEALERELKELKSLLKTQAEVQKAQQVRLDEQPSSVGYAASVQSGTSVGGYGEINYNNFDAASQRDEFDLQRFILFVGHEFNERTRMMSEIEFEHAQVKGGDSGGEVAMEQAYVEHTLTDGLNFRAGLQILPIGFMNEYHEPPVFHGVERNEVETRIIPSTWRELGFSINARTMSGFEYNLGLTTTPDASKFSSSSASKGFKDMRISGKQVTANDMGVYAGFNYRGILGLQLGATVWTGNTSQNGQGKGDNADELANVDATLTIWDIHAKYAGNRFEFKSLYAAGSLSDTSQINASAGIGAGSDDAAPEDFYGWYVETAYRIYDEGDASLVPFIRYAEYNTQKSVAPGFSLDPLNDESVTTLGLNWYVHPQVVFKLDRQVYDVDANKDRTNVGIGWMF